MESHTLVHILQANNFGCSVQAHEAVKDMDPRQHGSLRLVAPGHVSRWRHDVDTSSFLKARQVLQSIPCARLPGLDPDLNTFTGTRNRRSLHNALGCAKQLMRFVTVLKCCTPQGTSRYEVITAPAKPIRYSALRGSGHALFTGAHCSYGRRIRLHQRTSGLTVHGLCPIVPCACSAQVSLLCPSY